MRWMRSLGGVGGILILAWGLTRAAEPAADPPIPAEWAEPAWPAQPGCEALPPDAGCEECARPVKVRFGPTMFGDFKKIIEFPVTSDFQAFAIAVDRGAYKIAENESPLPQDRVYVNYNYYNNVRLQAAVPVTVDDVHRETLGLEKTFLGGGASVGLRLPFFQLYTDDPATRPSETDISDLSVVLKYALLNDLEEGNVLSTGMVVTAPTGPRAQIVLPDGTEVHSTLLQPYVGYLWQRNDFFLHGFTSVMVPTDSRDVTIFFNDVGVGYWLTFGTGRLFRGLVPTFEAHVNTPLNNRSRGDRPRFVDSVDLTAGTHFLLGERSTLGAAVATPVTGPRLFDVEAIVNFNFRW